MPDGNESAALPARVEQTPSAVADTLPKAVAAFEQFEPATSPLQDYVSILLRRKRTVIVALAVAFGTACAVTATMPRSYEATATLLVSQESGAQPGMFDGQVPSVMAAVAAPTLETHVELLQGEPTAKETANWLKEHGGPELSPGAIRGRLRAATVPKTQLVRVSARARSPQEAEKIANAAARSYVEMNRQRARSSSQSAGQYLGEQLAMARKNLAEAESALQTFKESTAGVTADGASAEVRERVVALYREADATDADVAQAKERLARIRSQLVEQNKSIAEGEVRNNTVIQDLRAKLVELEGKRLAAASRYTDAFSGPVAQIDAQVRIVNEQLRQEIRKAVGGSGDLEVQQALTAQLIQGEAELAALQARAGQLQADLRSVNEELQKLPGQQIALARLQRQVDVAQNIHSDLLTRSQEIEVGRVMALGNTYLAEPASTPRMPVKPNVPLNLGLGLLLGTGLGVTLAFLQEQLDDTVRDQEDVARVANAPVLGTVPLFQTRDSKARPLLDGPHGRTMEPYRTLRYNLGFVTPGDGGHVVVVTSASPLEGKTTTAVNLALAAASSGRRVILTDSDLRRPSVHRMLNLNGAKGITDVLVGEADVRQVLQPFPDSGLRVLSAGARAPNPTDLLESEQMRVLVERLRHEAELVILDSPPLLSVADSLVLATLSDAVLLVCVPGASNRRALQRSRLLLTHVGHPIAGVVLNKIEHRAGYGYYYQYYYYDSDRTDQSGDSGDEGIPVV
jgi:capsular exopolysaccharide synthesis family protein